MESLGAHLRRFASVALLALCGAALLGCGSSGSAGSGNAGDTPTNAAESPDFGTMKNVCHEATGTNKAGKHGVTATSIKITTISDAGSSMQKGLNQELWDAATVFTRWCNEHGGINGREIQFIKGDAQVTRYKEVIDQACKTSFALVGGGGALDDTGQKNRVDCGLVAVPGFVASPIARGAPLSYPALASGVNNVTIGGLNYLKAKYGANEPIGTIYGDFPSTEFSMDLRLAAAQSIGLASSTSPVNAKQNTYPVTGLDDWRPTAQVAVDSDARGILYSGQPTDLGKFITALGAQGAGTSDSTLKWLFADENMYDQVVIQTGRTGLANLPLYVQSFIYPFEEAGEGKKSEGMDDFLALFKHYLPNGKSRAMFAVSGFASWLLFAQAASACGDTLTRDCLVEKLKTTTEFDAGGLIAPRDPSDPSKSSECFLLLKGTPEGFERVEDPTLKPTPGEGNGVFNCGKENVANVSTSDVMKKWQDQVNEAFASDDNS